MLARSATGTADGATVFKYLTGWNFQETGGSTATVYIKKTDGSGAKVVAVNLAANESAGEQFGDNPLKFDDGAIFYVDITGAVTWIVYGSS